MENEEINGCCAQVRQELSCKKLNEENVISCYQANECEPSAVDVIHQREHGKNVHFSEVISLRNCTFCTF